MEERIYITEAEHEKCRKAADAFTELYKLNAIVVLDAGRYGFVKLQYYTPPHGFDNVETFTDGRELFECLWKEWLEAQLLSLAEGTPMLEMDYDDIFKCLPQEKQKELIEKRVYFEALYRL